MKNIDEIINISLLKYGQNLTKEQINSIPFQERVALSYEIIRKYKIENKEFPSPETISVIMNRLNISRIHVIERKNIIKYAMKPFTCSELFEAFNNSSEQLSNANIELIQTSINFAVNDALENYFFVSKDEGCGPDDVKNALQEAAVKLVKLKEFLEERNIMYNSENIDHWINLARIDNKKTK